MELYHEIGSQLFWMLCDRKENISIILNSEIEPDIPINSSLPDVICLIILLRVKRWMAQVIQQITCLFIELFTDA